MRRTQNGKVDEGFEWSYYKLSYRRKLIRTLWLIPFVFRVPYLEPATSGWVRTLYDALGTWGVTALFLTIAAIQAAYNYFMWWRTEAVRP